MPGGSVLRTQGPRRRRGRAVPAAGARPRRRRGGGRERRGAEAVAAGRATEQLIERGRISTENICKADGRKFIFRDLEKC